MRNARRNTSWRELIRARMQVGLTQEQVASRMGTRREAVVRIESGHSPSVRTLHRYAQAVSRKLRIKLVATR